MTKTRESFYFILPTVDFFQIICCETLYFLFLQSIKLNLMGDGPISAITNLFKPYERDYSYQRLDATLSTQALQWESGHHPRGVPALHASPQARMGSLSVRSLRVVPSPAHR